ncbi:hypothetical protein PVBG_05562 [Plasmodium vivax Brazil I]|uniref:Uncharacterized protein n=2 Tax=Plasmodium vivax TaxID=5855 RepID=A0A0J9T108_PLAV1|nr:hypothetical protein PVBG_05562 [Plasmodium vivax Brazil I]
MIFVFTIHNYYIKYIISYWGYSYNYTYVNEFPKFESEVSAIPDNSISSYQSDCQSFIDDKLSSYSDIKDAFLNRCAKIVKHLEDKKSTPEFKPAFCKYINYWLYDTLKDKNPFSSDTLLNAFYDKIKKISDCKTYKKHIDKEVYDELTELYKLHDHLIKYKKESIKGQGYSCKDGDEGANLYESYVVKCRWMYNPDYCTSLENFKKGYEEHSSNEDKKCSVKMQYLTPVGYNPEAHFLIAIFAMSIIAFVFIYFYKVCNNTILNIF